MGFHPPWQASAEKTQGQEAGFDVLMGPTCKNALIVGLGLVTLQQVKPNTLLSINTLLLIALVKLTVLLFVLSSVL